MTLIENIWNYYLFKDETDILIELERSRLSSGEDKIFVKDLKKKYIVIITKNRVFALRLHHFHKRKQRNIFYSLYNYSTLEVLMIEELFGFIFLAIF